MFRPWGGVTTFQFYKWVKDHGPVTFPLGKFDKKTLNAEQLNSVIKAAKSHTAKTTTDGADYIRARQEKKQEETFGKRKPSAPTGKVTVQKSLKDMLNFSKTNY